VGNSLSDLFTGQSVHAESVSFLGLAGGEETVGGASGDESSHQMGVQGGLALTRAGAVNDAAGVIAGNGRVVGHDAGDVSAAGVELFGGIGTVLVALGNSASDGHSDGLGLVAISGALAGLESALVGDDGVSLSVDARVHADAAPSLESRVGTISVALRSEGAWHVAGGINLQLVLAAGAGWLGRKELTHGHTQENGNDGESESLHCD